MFEDDIQDDPNYRFGVIMGRMQSLTDLMVLFVGNDRRLEHGARP